MSERVEDLRATAEDLIEDAEQLKQIEQTKLELAPDDPRLAELADEGREVVKRMRPKVRAQKELASEPESA